MTALHEYIGYLLKYYYYYSTNFMISHKSPKKDKVQKKMNENIEETDKIKKDEEQKEKKDEKEDGGGFVEKILFKEIKRIYICDILYILDIKNVEKNVDEFSNFFASEKRKEYIRGIKKIKNINIDEDLLKFMEKFNVKKGELVFAKPKTSMEYRTGSTSLYINITGGCLTHPKYDLF